MINTIRTYYLADRLTEVDQDFLSFEEDKAKPEDLTLIVQLLTDSKYKGIRIPNPHNSLLLYLTGLTEQFNPIKARADVEGGSNPDIDIDFDPINRPKMFEWAAEYYGREHTAQIGTFGRFKPRSIIQSFARVNEIDPIIRAKALKMIPPAKYGKEPSIKDILEAHPEFATDPEVKPFYEAALKLSDMVKTNSVHAAGIVVSDQPLADLMPIYSSGDFPRITQYNKDDVEAMGAIKFDFLVIDNLNVIGECLDLIENRHGIKLSMYDIPDHDEKTYQMMADGFLTGVFQMETSQTAANLIRRVKPKSIEELSDINALNRPGPMQGGLDEQYCQYAETQVKPDNMPAIVEEVLSKTKYTLVYQEQIMALCVRLAGFNDVEADAIRKAMGKKDEKKLVKWKAAFMEGCAKLGLVTQEWATDFWILLAGDGLPNTRNHGMADYCFNKAHASTYSAVTYICAWLKANYTIEFFCALMSARSRTLTPVEWASKCSQYVYEAGKLHIDIHPPSVNHSGLGFQITNDEVWFGLNGIRKVGKTATNAILNARGNTPFTSVEDFICRIDNQKVNFGVFQALIKAGCFDAMGYRRDELLEAAPAYYAYVHDILTYQERLVDAAERDQQIPIVEEICSKKEILKKKKKKTPLTIDEENFLEEHEKTRRLQPLKIPEKPVLPTVQRYSRIPLGFKDIMDQGYYLGCYLTNHPADLIREDDLVKIAEIKQDSDEVYDRVKIGVVVIEVKVITTKNKQQMAFLKVDDGTDRAELTVFPRQWANATRTGSIEVGDLLIVRAKVEAHEEETELKMLADFVQIHTRRPND